MSNAYTNDRDMPWHEDDNPEDEDLFLGVDRKTLGESAAVIASRTAGRLDCALVLGREHAVTEEEQGGFRELQSLSDAIREAIPRKDHEELATLYMWRYEDLSEAAHRLLDTWAREMDRCTEEETENSGPYEGYSAVLQIESWANPTLSPQHQQPKPFLHSGRFVSAYRRMLDSPVRVEFDPRVDMATIVAALVNMTKWVAENHTLLVTTEEGVNNFDLDDFLSD